jgi:hypothetical protein
MRMSDSQAIRDQLEAARQKERAAASKLRKAQKEHDAARTAANALQARVAILDYTERYRADTQLRADKGSALRSKLQTKSAKQRLTYPERDLWYLQVTSKGGWTATVQIDHNMVHVPPNGQSVEDWLAEFNEDRDWDYQLDEYDLSDHHKADWVWETHDGKAEWARLNAEVRYRPTGLGHGVDLEAAATFAIELDVTALPPTSEQILEAFDGAWQRMLDAELTALNPELLAAA